MSPVSAFFLSWAPAEIPTPTWAAEPQTGVAYGEARDISGDRSAKLGLTLVHPDGSSQTVTTDSDGRFLAAGLPPGDYTLSYDQAPFDLFEAPLAVQAGAYARTDVQLTRTELTVCVYDEDQLSVPAALTLRRDGAAPRTVDASGGCHTWERLAPGRYDVEVQPEDAETYLPGRIEGVDVDRNRRVARELVVAYTPEWLRAQEEAALHTAGFGSAGYGRGSGSLGARAHGRAAIILGSQGQASTEGYQHHGFNGWVDVADDPMSTFAADVDTGSYTLSRRKLRGWALPDPGGVRVEEFVNYFSYDYDLPRRGPLGVDMEAAPHPRDPDLHLLRIGVQGRALSSVEDDRPVHLTLLIDNSGSMQSDDKLGLVKRSMAHLVENLSPDDTIAIATYAGSVRRVLPPTPVREADAIVSALDGLRAGGSTAMSSGIELAYDLAQASYAEGHVNRVIVLSDGDANVGPSSHEEILAEVSDHAGQGITLSTIGFGEGNYQDHLMEQLADNGDGNYYYIDGMHEAERVFGRALAGTLEVIARDVKLQVRFHPNEVSRYRLLGYENRAVADEDFRDDDVDGGEIGAEHQVTALYEIELNDAARTRRPMATMLIRAKPPGPDARARELRVPLRTDALTPELPDASADMRLSVAAAGFAELLRLSPHAGQSSFRTQWAILDTIPDRDPLADQQRDELRELVVRADMIVQELWER